MLYEQMTGSGLSIEETPCLLVSTHMVCSLRPGVADAVPAISTVRQLMGLRHVTLCLFLQKCWSQCALQMQWFFLGLPPYIDNMPNA